MTMTEARPQAAGSTEGASALAEPARRSRDAVVDASDHKKVGLVLILGSLLALLVVRGVGAALGAELVSRGSQVVGDDSIRLWSLHETGLVLLWAMPMWLGLGTYLLPLQLGGGRLALPRVQALAAWTWVAGAGLFVAGHLVDPPPGVGLTDRTPLQAPIGGINEGTDLIIASFALLGLATLLAAGNLLATALVLRAPGLTLGRMPLLSWGIVTQSAVLLLATPVFLAGVLVLYLDLHFGGANAFAAGKAADLVWQKSLWLWGRPEALLLLAPAVGAAGDILLHGARRAVADPPQPPLPKKLLAKAPPPPAGQVIAAGAIFAIGAISLLTWAQDRQTLKAIVLPTASPVTALVAVPAALVVLLCLGTLGKERAKPTFAAGFVVAAILAGLTAGVLAVVAALVGVTGTAFSQGTVELITIGVPTLLALGALHHWSPKLFGRRLSAPAGGLALLTALGGTLALGVGHAVIGLAGEDQHVKELAEADARTGALIAQAGQVLVMVAVVVVLLDVARALAAGRRGEPLAPDLEEGATLEWAAASPPHAGGFRELPDVRSAAPLADLRAGRTTKGA